MQSVGGLLCTLRVALLAVVPSSLTSPPQLSTQQQLFPATSPDIRVVGRTAARPRSAGVSSSVSTTIYFDWSSVYIIARLTGPATIILHEAKNSSKAPQHPPGALGNSYLVTLDESRPVRLNTSASVQEYALGLQGGETATVRIEKVTEAREDSGGVVGFVGFYAAALHPQPAAPVRRVECIGDSIMCGAHSERGAPLFPSDCKDEKGGNRESSHLSWCPTLARAFGADYTMECCSGNGLVYTDNPTSNLQCDWGLVPPTCPVMPLKWQQRLMCATDGVFIKSAGVCDGLGGLEPLDTDPALTPHAVIINLGQNDYGSGHIPSKSLWIKAYTSFVKNISATYGGLASSPPQFFLACGGMADKCKYILRRPAY